MNISKNILEDSKAEQITLIDIKAKSSYADYLIIATCRSSRHVSSVAEDLIFKLKRSGVICPELEGKPRYDWTIIDAGNVVIHLFKPEIRLHYNLEKLWDISLDSLKTI